MELSSTCPLFYLVESSRHHRRLQDEVPTLIPEDLRQLSSAAAHLLDVDHHHEAMEDRREGISTHTDQDLCRGHDRLDNTEVRTEVAQDLIPPDRDHHQEDEGVEDETALEGMVRGGEVQATAVTAAMTIAVEVEVVEGEAEDGVDTVELISHKMALGKISGLLVRYQGCYVT